MHKESPLEMQIQNKMKKINGRCSVTINTGVAQVLAVAALQQKIMGCAFQL